MDIMNMQNFLVNQAPIPAFAEKNSAPVRQPQQKANSFASRLNNAVERSANGAFGNEAAQSSAGMEKTTAFNNNENKMVNKARPMQPAEDNRADGATATGGEQPLVNGNPENPDQFLGAASLVAQMPNGENTVAPLTALQGNFFSNQPEQPALSLTAENLKGLSLDAETLETMFSNANSPDKGQVTSQNAANALNELLTAAKQDLDGLAAKGEVPKNAGVEGEVVLQQPNDAAKQPHARLQSVNPADELAKPGTEQGKPVVEIAKLTVIDAAKSATETAKPNEQPPAGETGTTVLTPKAPMEQNSSNRQAGQQPFDQTMESKAGELKNPEQLNNNHTFAISFNAATQTPTDKTGATQAQPQQTPDFAETRDEFQIKAQIVQQATLINRSAQESEMLIRLKPEHLGEMALKVTVTNGVVNASFHSNNAEVRGVLENSIQQLKNDLANAGFKVDNVSISAGLSQFAADQERAMQWQQQHTRRGSGKKGEEGYTDAVESIAANQQVINASKDAGVDYRI